MGVNFLETFFLVKLLRDICGKYYAFERWLDEVYKDSVVHKTIKSFLSKAAIIFRYSFLGRITEVSEGKSNPGILDNSKVAKWVLNFYNKWKAGLLNYSNASKIVYSAVKIKRGLYFFPAKFGGIIVFTAVLTNMLSSLLMRKEIGVWGWSMRGVLLFVGFGGMFCKAEWDELKKTSCFMRYLEKRRLLLPTFRRGSQ